MSETVTPFPGNEQADTSWDISKIPLHRPPASALRDPGPIQRKLKVGDIDDPLEHEADRVADEVMRIPAESGSRPAQAPVNHQTDTHENGNEKKLRKRDRGPQHVAGETYVSVDETLQSDGQPLDAESHAFFSPRFGRDLSHVRIHADARAADSANSVYARAYTVGHHVVFGRYQYAPHTADGRRLLAHELAHTLQQPAGVPILRRDPPRSLPPARPDLENRLTIIEETGAATRARLDHIIRTGGPMPNTKDGAKVIGAAIIDVEGYEGPTEMRAINGADTDALGKGAATYHASTPTSRTLSATQGPRTEKGGRGASIRGPRSESIFPHINDAEIKLFEDIIPRLPRGAKGTIHFITVRVAKGQTVPEPYPACSGCIRATFEAAGRPGIDLVSHAPVHPPMATGDLGGSQVGTDQAEQPLTDADPERKSRTSTDADSPGGAASEEATTGKKAARPAPPTTAPATPPVPPAPKTAPVAKPATAEPETARTTRPAKREPAARQRPTAEPEAARTRRTAAPEAPEPAPAKRRGPTPPEAADAPPGRPGSLEVIGHAQAGATAALVSQSMTRLNEVARRYPEDKDLAWTVSTVNTVLEAEGLIKDPKGFVAGKIKAGMFEAISSHYRNKLAALRQSFENRFPSLAQIHQDPVGSGASLESYRKDYEAAHSRLRVPGARRAFLYVGVALASRNDPPEVLAQRLRAVDEAIAKAPDTADDFEKYQAQYTRYQFTLFLLANRLEQLSVEYGDLPAGMAGDLHARGKALGQAARVFRDTHDSVWRSGMVVFVPVLDFAQDLETAADDLDAIAGQFESFAAAVDGRRGEYDREVRRLRSETTRIAERPLLVR